MSEIIYERPGLSDSPHDGKALIDSGRFAFFLFLGVEVMLFAGLIGGYIILHGGASAWPPDNAPALSLFRAALASLLLLAASIVIGMSGSGTKPASRLLLGFTLLLLFVSLVTADSFLLAGEGLKATEVYGGIYYLLAITFAVHGLAGLIATWNTYSKARKHALRSNSLPHLSYFVNLVTLAWFAVALLIHS